MASAHAKTNNMLLHALNENKNKKPGGRGTPGLHNASGRMLLEGQRERCALLASQQQPQVPRRTGARSEVERNNKTRMREENVLQNNRTGYAYNVVGDTSGRSR